MLIEDQVVLIHFNISKFIWKVKTNKNETIKGQSRSNR